MDIVFIRELRVDALIGVYDWERTLRQTLVFDLEMGADIRPAAATDDITLALDYHAVSSRLAAIVQDSSFQLVESLAETLASTLMAEFDIPWLRLRIAKPGAVPGAREVGLIIERGQSA